MQRPSRRIIILSDGTGNSAGKIFKTNVWRLYQALRLSNTEQIAIYDDGVGTSNFKPLAILGGAIGWGLKRNLLDLYTFLCRNYRTGDEIFFFGFSRGAFTVRVLVKFILSQGIVDDFYSDDDLRRQAKSLYRDFRRSRTTRFGLATAGRAIRDALVWIVAKLLRQDQEKISVKRPHEIEVHFIGVWDTVDAYGIPIYELKKGIDQYIWPLGLEDIELDPRVRKACHAIGLDDKRKTFHPLIWNENDQSRFPKSDSTEDEKLTQVFFAGVHSNIGGGYPDDGLSYTSLNWMMKEAAKKGLEFDATATKQIADSAAPFGKLYDSRSGLGAYYRYEPRSIFHPTDNESSRIIHPKVHETVLLRMAVGSDSYGPLALPENSRVVIESNWSSILDQKWIARDVVTFSEYVCPRDRSNQAYGEIALEDVAEDIKFMERPEKRAMELIWDTVWWRRIAYFSTLFVSFFIFISPKFPLFRDYPIPQSIAVAFGLTVSNETNALLVSPIVNVAADGVSNFVPGLFSPWIKAFREEPFNALCLSGLLVGCVLWGALIDRRINDRSTAIWNKKWSDQRLDWFFDSVKWRARAALIVSVISALLILWLVYEIKYVRPDCRSFGCFDAIFEQIARIVVAGSLGPVVVAALIAYVANRRIARSSVKPTTEPRGVLLSIANWLRTSAIILAAYKILSARAIPAAFALVVVLGSVGLANRAAFVAFNVTGRICQPLPKQEDAEQPAVVALHFDDGCQATKIRLYQGQKYTIHRQVDLEEFDADTSASLAEIERDDEKTAGEKEAEKKQEVEKRAAEKAKLVLELQGLPKNSALPEMHSALALVLMPVLRAPTRNWFEPTLRIGNTGDVELTVTNSERSYTPNAGGDVYLYLNNAVIGWPRIYDYFYRQSGTMLVRIEEADD